MEEIVNKSEVNKFSDDSSKSYNSDMQPENIIRIISSKSERRQKLIFSTIHGEKQEKRGLIFLLLETRPKWQNLKFRKLTIIFQDIYYPRDSWAYKKRNKSIRSTVPAKESSPKRKIRVHQIVNNTTISTERFQIHPLKRVKVWPSPPSPPTVS